MPRVSVVIPAFNAARFLRESVKSALCQVHVPHEVIVVDDGSTDDTPRVLLELAARITILHQPNRGVSAARNSGAEKASGELLAFLDADDVWLPHKLARQVARMQSYGDAGLVHCGVRMIDLDGRPLGERLDGMEGSLAPDTLFFGRGVILAAGSTALIPRDVFTEAGGFDDALSTSADWDLCHRIARRRPVAFVREALVLYRQHDGNMHRNVRVMERDMLRGFAKAFEAPPPEILALRRSAYAGLYTMLAGSYYRAGARRDALRTALLALRTDPSRAWRFCLRPARALRHAMSPRR
jgi:glycosyltransferase involved in cell wall biosynthesis